MLSNVLVLIYIYKRRQERRWKEIVNILKIIVHVVVVQSLNRAWFFFNPWTKACQASLSFSISHRFLILMSTELVMPSILSSLHPLFLLPSIFPSIRVFSNESALHIRWPILELPASASILSVNIQGCIPLGLTGLISLLSKGLLKVFSRTMIQKHQSKKNTQKTKTNKQKKQKHQSFGAQHSSWSNSHIHTWLLEKP